MTFTLHGRNLEQRSWKLGAACKWKSALHCQTTYYCYANCPNLFVALFYVQLFVFYQRKSKNYFSLPRLARNLFWRDLRCIAVHLHHFFCATQRENLWDTDLRPKLAPFQVDFLTPFGSIWAVCQVYAFWLLLSKVRVVSSWQQAEDREDQKTQSDQQTMRNELLLHGCFQDPSKKTAQVASSRAQGNQKDVLR